MLKIDLSKMAGGALQEKFNREITKVIENHAGSEHTIFHSEKYQYQDYFQAGRRKRRCEG